MNYAHKVLDYGAFYEFQLNSFQSSWLIYLKYLITLFSRCREYQSLSDFLVNIQDLNKCIFSFHNKNDIFEYFTSLILFSLNYF